MLQWEHLLGKANIADQARKTEYVYRDKAVHFYILQIVRVVVTHKISAPVHILHP